MATVHEAPARINSPPSAWPAWTDTHRADLPLAAWLRARVDEHARAAREDDDLHELLAAAVNDILCVVLDRGCRTVEELLAAKGTPYHLVRLGRVGDSIPALVPADARPARTSRLADMLDEQARWYLDTDTPIATVCAWAILQHAEACEWYGSQSLSEYADDDAAWLAACDSIDHDGEYPCW